MLEDLRDKRMTGLRLCVTALLLCACAWGQQQQDCSVVTYTDNGAKAIGWTCPQGLAAYAMCDLSPGQCVMWNAKFGYPANLQTEQPELTVMIEYRKEITWEKY